MERIVKALGVVCAAVAAAPAFAGFDEFITFDEVMAGVPVDGLTVKNATFSIGDRIGTAIVGNGPTTPNGSGQMILGTGFGQLGIKFGQPVSRFGFGFGLFTDFEVENAVCVDLFDEGGAYLGTVKQDAEENFGNRSIVPVNGFVFADGFGCIASAVISFQLPVRGGEGTDSAGFGFAFFFDNLGYDFCGTVIPLPTPGLMGATGLLALGAVRRRRTS